MFTFFLAAYSFTASADIFGTGDTTIRVEVAENLWGRLGPNLSGWNLTYPNHIKKEYLETRVAAGRFGDTYSTYLLGQPLAIIPLDIAASHLAVHLRWPYGPTILFIDRLVGPIFGALEALIFFIFAIRLGYGRRRSVLLTLIFGFATSVWPDEQSALEHTEVAFFLLLGAYFAFRFREQQAPRRYLLWSGLAIGGATITRYQDAFLLVVALGVYFLLPSNPEKGIRRRLSQYMLFGIGLVPGLIIDLWYNWVRFGSILATGHRERLFGYIIWKGALGLTISPGKGLLWYCPTIFLLILAARPFARRYGAFAVSIAVLAAIFCLFYGYITFWHGDPAWGPRYMYPLVPFLTLPLGELLRWRGGKRTAVWATTAAVVVLSFGIQFAAVSVSEWRGWYRVISYETNQGYQWQWIASRYRYFWNVHESPLIFQVHGLYQLVYDAAFHSQKYVLVPPAEVPTLDNLATSYAINQWNFWWKSNELSWWMGEQKVVAMVVLLVAVMVASGTYVAAETSGLFDTASEDALRDTEREAA